MVFYSNGALRRSSGKKLSRITLKVEHECLLFKINLKVHILLHKRDVSTFVEYLQDVDLNSM